MSTTVDPRLVIVGTAHQVRPLRVRATDSTPARDAAAVVVLTDEGGFVEVYYGPDALASGVVPARGQAVAIRADVSARKRTSERGFVWADLNCRYVDQAFLPETAAPAAYDAQPV